MVSMLRNRVISKDANLLEALKTMDQLDKKLLIVLDGDKYFGLLSIGDIQRAIIQNKAVQIAVKEILRDKVKIASPDDPFPIVRQMMFDFRMELCPVVNEHNQIVNVYFWEDIFQENEAQPASYFQLPVVIMAGGKGSRLKPLTNVLPKPLIPIGEKSILENIFSRFNRYGCDQFYVSVNYKADLIEYYIKSQQVPFQVEFFREDKPLGTAGSLSLLKGKINTTFFVSNCDILVEQDYSDILDYHTENRNEITIVAVMKHLSIPYGTIETTVNGQLVKLTEKPDFSFKINSGMYIVEPHILNEVPDNEYIDITQLIDRIVDRNGKVGVFPVSEKSWKDIGEWSEYLRNYGGK
jgi:dTDP-glucose pyrophosphorylase